MNIQKLSLSAALITGLSVSVTPTCLQAKFTPGYVGIGAFLGFTLLTLRLNAKKSAPNPEENYTWSDIPSNLLKGDFREAGYAFDEKFIGQKAEPTSLKIVEGDDDKVEIKGSGKTPATGVCGTTQAYLGQFAKAALDTCKVSAAPLLVIGAGTKLIYLSIEKGALSLGVNEKVFEKLFGAPKAKTDLEKAQELVEKHGETLAVMRAAKELGLL